MNRWILPVVIVVMVALHQDSWFWSSRRLIFGFLPIGLAYHVCYSILASLVMVFLVRYAWPSHLERLEPHHDKSQER